MSKIFDTYYSALMEDRLSQKVGGGGDNNEEDNDEQWNNVDVGWDNFNPYTCGLAWIKEFNSFNDINQYITTTTKTTTTTMNVIEYKKQCQTHALLIR